MTIPVLKQRIVPTLLKVTIYHYAFQGIGWVHTAMCDKEYIHTS
jgi:hypothetical protein